MDNFELLIGDLVFSLNDIKYKGDLSDIGNEIGIVLGRYIKKDKMGYELEDFIHGVKHGISLTDGTH